MSIEIIRLEKPINIEQEIEELMATPSHILNAIAMSLTTTVQLPPDHRRDITPADYPDRIFVRAYENMTGETVGQIIIKRINGVLTIALRGKIMTNSSDSLRVNVGPEQPVFVISKPNHIDGGVGTRIDALVRYIPNKN